MKTINVAQKLEPLENTLPTKILHYLEHYKRIVGRRFDKAPQYSKLRQNLWHEYNDLESCIQYIVDKTGCKRKSKPYKLPVRALGTQQQFYIDNHILPPM